MRRKRFHTYIVLFLDGYLYTGSTGNLRRRNKEHYKKRLGAKLIWKEAFLSREAALDREFQIKRWTRAKKLALAGFEEEILFDLARRKSSGK